MPESTAPNYVIVLPWRPENQGGVSGVALYLSKALNEAGSVSARLWVNSWERRKALEQEGLLEFRFALLGGAHWLSRLKSLVRAPLQLWRCHRLLQQHKVAVLNFHYPDAAVLGPALLKRLGFYPGKLILSFHGTDVRREAHWPERCAMAFALSQADAIVAVSRGLQQRIEVSFGIASERIRIIWNGADTSVFRPRAERFLPKAASPRSTIVSVGAFIPRKAQAILLEAFAALARQSDELELVFAGADGPTLAPLQEQAQRLGLATRVHFQVGLSREAVAELLANATLCVQPALAESLPLAVLEAGACAAPLLVSDIPGHDEMIRHGQTGLRFTVNHVESCQAALQQALDDPARMRSMAERFHQEVVTEHLWSQCAARYLALAGFAAKS